MKKIFCFAMILALLAALCIPAAAAKDDSFKALMISSAPEQANAVDENNVRFIIPWDDGLFTAGEAYTFFCTCYFCDDVSDIGGCAYVNAYAFSTLDDARGCLFTGLNNFIDFAKCSNAGGNAAKGVWADYTTTFDPTIVTYGGNTSGLGNVCGGISIGIGFWNAYGTMYVKEVGVKNSEDEIIFSKTFEYGLDLDDPDFVASAMINEDTEGEVWAILDFDVEELPDESSEDEPIDDPDEPSEDEPIDDSSEEAPVESSEDVVIEDSVPDQKEDSVEEPIDEPADDSVPETDPVSNPAAESNAEESAPAAEKSGLPTWALILIIAAGAAVIAVVVVIIIKKKK